MRTKPNDTSVEAPAERTVKGPKGSKLDAKKRAEYQSDVASAEAWDTSTWPTWTVSRVVCCRSDVTWKWPRLGLKGLERGEGASSGWR
jgi:hypothetical protein